MLVMITDSYGTLTVHPDTGDVLAYDHDGASTDYADIVRFDVQEFYTWLNSCPDLMARTAPVLGALHLDILEIGFWALTGDYVAPESDFRTEILTNV